MRLPTFALGALSLLAAKTLGRCLVDLDAVSGEYPPLLVQNGEMKYPSEGADEEKRLVTVENGEVLSLVCHGSYRYQAITKVKIEGLPEQQKVDLICFNGLFQEITSQKTVSIESASCNRKQEPKMRRWKELCAPIGVDGRFTDLSGKLSRVSIGWEIEGNFIEQVGLCIDEAVYGTLWTNHTIHGANIAFQDSGKRPIFRTDSNKNKRFFPWTSSYALTRIYSKNSQAATVKKILGTSKFQNKTIIENSRSGTKFFAKGHLSPDAAFVYNIEQDSTYYYTNVAPQFQSFNNGNWKALEYNTRDLAEKLGRDLKVTTGTWGVLQYPNTEEVPTDIRLFNNSYIPAPLYYWKIVEDPETDSGAVFIGLNEPHRDNPPVELCENKCKAMDWVDWDYSNMKSGYMYCCSIEEAKKVILAIPRHISVPSQLVQLNPTDSGSGTVTDEVGTCTAGPCTCTCSRNEQQVYTCTCNCQQP